MSINTHDVYELVYSPDLTELSASINDRIAEGWWPVGRPFVHGEHYIQAMVSDHSGRNLLLEDLDEQPAH